MCEVLFTCNVTENLARLAEEWKRSRQSNGPDVSGTDTCASRYNYGGGVFSFDLESQTFYKLPIDIEQPNGFALIYGQLAIASMATNQICLFINLLECTRTLRNQAFNDLHSIVPTQRGYLITSSGVDAIIEVDDQGNTVWGYWFVDEGYNQTPLGHRRIIDKMADHSHSHYPTLHQTTHVNSAIILQDESGKERFVLATLFHQGELVQIDRETNKCTVILDGLRCPHSIRQYGDIFLLCDSANGRVLMLNRNYEIIKELKDDFTWVQDAIYLEEKQTIVLVDANNFRLVFWNIDNDQKEFVMYDENWRIFQIESI